MRPWWPLLALLCLLPSPANVAQEATPTLLTHGASTLELQLDPAFTATQRKDVTQWIEHITDSLLQVYGRWPRDQWRITVEPASGSSSDSIPWGQVNRGRVDTVRFYILADAGVTRLTENWTSYHELAHLLIPYKGSGDSWFSEGLASYYQNLLQARIGLIDEQVMWQKLLDGFLRGRQQAEFDGISLAEISDGMPGNRAFMRVYWSGAWYFLAADVQLRQQSGGKFGLDDALDALNRCCAEQQLSAAAIASKLDSENRIVLFEPLFRQARQSHKLPDFESLYASLGIRLEDGRARLQTQGPGVQLRQGITARKSL
ncbi:MAG: hypothetical protein ABJK20_00260 [Halieaceae bacterium]